MTKAELKREFLALRARYMADDLAGNEYALHLMELLEEYLRVAPVDTSAGEDFS